MRTTNTYKVVMLPTEKASNIGLVDGTNHLYYGKDWLAVNYEAQHLYIISDEEIKEGDWCIMLDDFENVFSNPQQWLGKGVLNKNLRKIIASTDKFLQYNLSEAYIALPLIPESFIQAYVKFYNEGKPITEVNLEMSYKGQLNDESNTINSYHIKTRADNTVIIHSSKVYTRENCKFEIKRLIILERNYRNKYSHFIDESDLDNWIDKNL